MEMFSNLWQIFYRPSAVAQAIRQKPTWVVPVIVVFVLLMINIYVTYDYTVEYQKRLLEKAGRASGAESETENLVTPAKRITAGVVAGVGAIVVTLICAAVLHGVAQVAGGTGGFSRMFALYAYAGVISAVGAVLKLPLILAKHSLDVRTSLALLAPNVAFDSPAGVLLNSVDVFAVWMLAAASIGYSVLSGLGIRKSVVVVVILYLVFVALSVGGAVMRSRMLG